MQRSGPALVMHSTEQTATAHIPQYFNYFSACNTILLFITFLLMKDLMQYDDYSQSDR
jgi:hypothetical protein